MRAELARGIARARRPGSSALLGLLFVHGLACGEDVVLGDGRAAQRADAGTANDGGGEAPAFSAPIPIARISTQDTTDDDPSLSADLTLLFFNSEREGGAGKEDIWFARRDSLGAPWEPPRPATELNSEDRETGIALMPDGLAIFWSSDRPDGAGGLDVYTAERAHSDAPWTGIRRVPELSSPGDDLISAIADDGATALLARRADADDDYDLFRAERPDRTQAFSEPSPIAELNGDEEESDAFLVEGGLGLVFTRAGDLHLARRAERAAAFGAAVALEALNSEGDDRDAWATPDLRYLIFSSDRSGSYALYEAMR